MSRSGGRYVVDDSGKPVLVERTGWTPPARTKKAKVPREDSATAKDQAQRASEVNNHAVP